MSRPTSFPARLHVLFASNGRNALIIRRGPSKWVATIGWDRKTDTFVLGQWLKGRIYEYKTDLSPNGQYFIYFYIKSKIWTVLSRYPYLKALDLYAHGTTYGGGGTFISDHIYSLTDKKPYCQAEFKNSGLEVLYDGLEVLNGVGGECPEIYIHRLKRGGWSESYLSGASINFSYISFFKQINNKWLLVKHFHASIPCSAGKGVHYETHQLYNTKTSKTIDYPDWEWADVDDNRLVWAEKGKLMSGSLQGAQLEEIKELYDFNEMVFEEKIAPY